MYVRKQVLHGRFVVERAGQRVAGIVGSAISPPRRDPYFFIADRRPIERQLRRHWERTGSPGTAAIVPIKMTSDGMYCPSPHGNGDCAKAIVPRGAPRRQERRNRSVRGRRSRSAGYHAQANNNTTSGGRGCSGHGISPAPADCMERTKPGGHRRSPTSPRHSLHPPVNAAAPRSGLDADTRAGEDRRRLRPTPADILAPGRPSVAVEWRPVRPAAQRPQ